MSAPTADAIMNEVSKLPDEMQARVLDFVRSLSGPKRALTGKEFLSIPFTFDPEDLDVMEQAIKDGCERIDEDGW